MTEFEQHVVDKLDDLSTRTGRMEGKLENGIVAGIAKIEGWIDKWSGAHPTECPLRMRKRVYVVPVTVAILTAVALRVLDKVVERIP